MKIQMLQEKLTELNMEIEKVLRMSGYLETMGLTAVEWDRENREEALLYQEYAGVLNHLDFVYTVLGYLQKPVACEGTICVNQAGKFELGGTELKQGDLFEILEAGDSEDAGVWTRVFFDKSRDYTGKIARKRDVQADR